MSRGQKKFLTLQKHVFKLEAPEKVTGRIKYTFDLTFPGMLYAKILRSDVPHARIVRIDTSQAMKVRGVKAVITHENTPANRVNPIYNSPDPRSPSLPKDQMIFDPVIRYVGAPIAAVAADNLEAAQDALDLINVSLEALQGVFDPEDAMKPMAPRVREELPGNIAPGWTEPGRPITLRKGDIDMGFKEADLIHEDTYRTQRVNQVPLETLVCVCAPGSSPGRIDVWSSTQSIFGLRSSLSQVLGISAGSIRVFRPIVGGGFGSKLEMGFHEPIAAVLAMKTGRPVRLELSREEIFFSTARHPSIVTLRTGVKKDGTITARYCRIILDIGALANHGPSVTLVGGTAFLGSYRSPNYLLEGYPVYTNNFPSGAMRGYGGVQVNFAVECHMDVLAEKLALDPIKFRLKNAFGVGDKSPVSGFKIQSCGLDQCAKIGSEIIEWSQGHRPKTGRFRRGTGVAFANIFYSGVHGSDEMPEQILEYSGALVKVNEDGTVNLTTAVVDQGGGQSTVLAQIVADEMGIDIHNVIVSDTDTDTAPFDVATHAGRVTYVAGYAAMLAAREAKKQLLDIASTMLKIPPDKLHVSDGYVNSSDRPEEKKSIAEVAWYAQFHAQKTIIGKASTKPPDNPSPFGVVFAEVEVDMETGRVKVLKVTDVHDIGKVLNILGAEGQIEGGIGQALGFALCEEVVLDKSNGRVLNGNFLDYKVVTSVETPEIHVRFVPTKEPSGVGAKSVAETATLATAPAVVNAIYDAIGIRLHELPVTPEKVLRALNK